MRYSPSMISSGWRVVAWWLVAGGLAGLPPADAATTNLVHAGGQITVTVTTKQTEIPPLVVTCWPLAAKAVESLVGLPEEPASLTIRLREPPSFGRRLGTFWQEEVFAIQHGDVIEIYAEKDPLKLSFRLAHELCHWVVAQRYPAQLPLWLDEGLAQMAGDAAAQTAARVHKQSLLRPEPLKLSGNLLTLRELTALTTYPAGRHRVAAFYWQAEALTRHLHQRLGAKEFAEYLTLLGTPTPPTWQAPLRERWYFSDDDFAWLDERLHPQPAGGTP